MVGDQRGLGVLAGLLVLIGAPAAQGHPAHAKPVNYPFVIGFERFHSGLDDEDYLAEGGFILLNELNCVGCHAPPEALREQFPGVIGTALDGVGSRLSPIELEIFVRNPRFVKRDTLMPSLFAGPDRDLDEVAALRTWLGTLVKEIPAHPRGDIERGRALYHRIGCAACHAPEVGYRPEGIPDFAEIELAGLPSVPMNLADLYDLDALTEFLLHSNEHRPSGRMPDFQLSLGDASDLAAYLKAGPDLTLPENLTEALGVDETPEQAGLAEQGRELFFSKQCHACHTIPGGDEGKLAGPAAKLLAELDPHAGGGCLTERPVPGAPFYGLDLVQRRAITAALARLPQRPVLEPARAIDWGMKLLNCYACHEREGIGGPETSREVYFGFADAAAMQLGREGHLPPALDGVGRNLDPARLAEMLFAPSREKSARPHLVVPMPRFRREIVAPFAELLPAADAAP